MDPGMLCYGGEEMGTNEAVFALLARRLLFRSL